MHLLKKYSISLFLIIFIITFSKFLAFWFDVPSEDMQNYIFVFLSLSLFFILKFHGVRLPLIYYLLPLFLWSLLNVRVYAMREMGFYEGRIIVGKFENDLNGYKAREFSRELRRVSQAYKLPGVNVVPISRINDSKVEKWLEGENRASLIIIGKDDGLLVYFPSVYKTEKEIVTNLDFPFKRGVTLINLNGFDNPLVVPGAPDYLRMPQRPLPVMAHYLSWLSGFFHPLISQDSSQRIDVINEAARVKGPWASQIPRIFARFLFSLEEFRSSDLLNNPMEVNLIQERLERALTGLEHYHHAELFASTMTLIALCELSRINDESAQMRAEKLLEKVVYDKKIKYSEKLPAIFNLTLIKSRE